MSFESLHLGTVFEAQLLRWVGNKIQSHDDRVSECFTDVVLRWLIAKELSKAMYEGVLFDAKLDEFLILGEDELEKDGLVLGI